MIARRQQVAIMSDESKDPEGAPENSEAKESTPAEALADSAGESAKASESAPSRESQSAPELTEKPEIPAIGKKQTIAEIKETRAAADAEKPAELVTERPKEEAKPEAPKAETAKTEAPKAEPAEAKAEPAKPEATAKPAPPKAVPPKAPPSAGAAASGAAKPAPPAKKGPTVTEEIKDDPFIDKLKAKFGDAITEAVKTFGQRIVRVKKDAYVELCHFLVEDEDGAFTMCADLTAVHWPDRTGQEFDIVVNLYSVTGNQRLRVKTSIAEGEAAPSVTPIWEGANWMEREVFDMFGVKFDGHPDLRRILLPEDWPGYPLRKEYPIEYRDNEWTDKHIDYREVEYDTSLIDVKYAERR